MINTLILTLASLIGADGYETIPVVTSVPSSEVVLVCNGYGCGAGGCRTGSCSGGGCASGNCSPGYSSYSYTRPAYVQSAPVYTLPTLNLIIADMPTNQQRNRFYVKARVNGKMYNIPVINGIIPTINSRHENELVLTYSTGKQFHASMFGETDYVNYSTSNTNTTVSALKTFDNGGVKARTEPTASALKHPDSMPKETPFRSSRPDDDKVENFLRNAAPSAPKRVMNDDTLDNFLQKPSSIGDSDRAFPRY